MIKLLFLFIFSLFFSPFLWAEKPDLILAKFYNESIHLNISDYLISEKLDGVRAFWDGEYLYTRNGNKIHTPNWFTEKFPKIKLDGELWMGRTQFNAISTLIRKKISKENNEEWKKVQYMLFELPENENIFQKRYENLIKITNELNIPWLKVIPQFNLKNKDELNQKLDKVLKEGGEGLMLHLENAPYVTGRSDFLLKLKPWIKGKAKILAYIPGRGKLTGKTGALKVQDETGKVFLVGSGLNDEERLHPPPLGSLIHYRFREYTHHQKPRFPIYVR